MGHVMHLVKPIGEEAVFIAQTLRKHTKELGRKLFFANAVQMIERSQSGPAQVHRRENMQLAPVHNRLVLLPVVDALEGEVLNRGAGNDEAIIVLVHKMVERVVELHQVVRRHVLGLMRRHAHEVTVHLNGRLGNESQDLGFGFNFGGHEVKNGNFEWSNLLVACDLVLKREDALLMQNLLCR